MKKTSSNEPSENEKIFLQLFVAGMSERSMQAIENIKRLCDELIQDAFELEIIDLYKHPELAAEHQIIFSPSLIKRFPLPKKTLIGDFSNPAKLIKALGISFKEE